jgi:glyoxylase-like metal-dependent hydrolase (beta-lactamase superfamily II)
MPSRRRVEANPCTAAWQPRKQEKTIMPRSKLGLTRRQLAVSMLALGAAPLACVGAATPVRAAAPRLGVDQPTHYRFKLGAFEITMILDSDVFIDGPWPLIGTNASQEDVDALMSENLLPANKYQPGFTPMVVNTGRELVLFDTGNGERGFVPRPAGGWLAAKLAPAGFKPEDIDLVVLSHGHPDHIGGLYENGRPLFPNARYAVGEAEYDFWSPENRHSGDLEKFAALFRDYVVPLREKTAMLKPGADIAPGIRAVESYGHTPGHLSFRLESEGRQVFFLGDCAHHHVASLARPDWHCVFDVDPEKGAATRARLFDMLASERIAVAAYHMPFPSLGYIERLSTGGYRWLLHSYQLNL